MLGIGLPELIVIALVMVVFIRPEDLPAFFRSLGRLYAKAKKAYDEVSAIKDDFVRRVKAAASEEDSPAEPGSGDEPPRDPPESSPRDS
jgi:Sec-independent protein translocase protein TatA